MKVISDQLAIIATDLGLEYIRESSLSEANVEVHYKKTLLDLMIYVGNGNISTEFLGAQQVDAINCQIYFLTRKGTTDPNGVQIDDLLAITKRYADKTYYQLQAADNTQNDIPAYTLEPVEILTAAYAGHMMDITIPVNNDGC